MSKPCKIMLNPITMPVIEIGQQLTKEKPNTHYHCAPFCGKLK